MIPRTNVPPERGWVVTEAGRAAADQELLCVCDVHLMGILLACPDCGTVYGSILNAKRPRAQRWTKADRA